MATRQRSVMAAQTSIRDSENLCKGAAVTAQGLQAKRHVLGDIQNKVQGQTRLLLKRTNVAVPQKPVARTNTLAGNVVELRRPTRAAAVVAKTKSSNVSVDSSAVSTVNLTVNTANTTTASTVNTTAINTVDTTAVSTECIPMETSHHEAYSAKLMYVHNIDDGDEENPLLVTEYVNDIYDYLRQLEINQGIGENYLEGNSKITPRMRVILVDWLAQVHSRFSLLPETFYMTVSVLDRYLQVVSCTKEKLQLIGVTAMFISSKYEEIYAPEIGDFVYITDNAYTKKDIRQAEIDILKVLNFNLGRPLPIHFLRRFSKAADADARKHSVAKYLMELCLVDYNMADVLPSKLAAGALYLSMLLLDQTFTWNDTMVHYTKYSEVDLQPTLQKIATVVLKAHSPNAKQTAIRKKYETTKFLETSKLSCLSGPKVMKLAHHST